jgi:hypothetical protein
VDGLVELLRGLVERDSESLARMGRRAQGVLEQGLSKSELCGRLCDILEQGPAAGRVPS